MTSTPSILPLLLAAVIGWGFWDSWFGTEPEVARPDTEAVAEVLEAEITGRAASLGLHPTTTALYDDESPTLLWASSADRSLLTTLLDASVADGVGRNEIRADDVAALRAQLAEAARAWADLDPEARDTLADPRPARLVRLDLTLTDGLVRLGSALLGQRADPMRLYPGVWFPTARDSSGVRWRAYLAALRSSDATAVRQALDHLRPQQEGYRRLRARLAALQGDLAPIPSGAALRAGQHSVRVPHLRDRLAALGYLPADTLDAWHRPSPYGFDVALAAALGRFEAAHGLARDSVLDAEATALLNADPADLRRELALNLERWRWLPDDLGERFVWVNLPSFEIRVLERSDSLGGGYAERLRMPANIGNAQTTGWTTPVITDSIHTIEFQPVWYVPRSLAAANIFPMARRDSLALWRQGIEAFRNGAPVDTRLVPWDSVSVGEFRFVQRPGPANPLGRVKFMMHNPYAILIHDTNKRQTFSDGAGSSMSSGCVHAGFPDLLAEYLLTTTNDWEPGAARAAWQRGPRRGVRMAQPVLTHFTYFTAWVEVDGALRLYGDPYGYDDRLAAALGLTAS